MCMMGFLTASTDSYDKIQQLLACNNGDRNMYASLLRECCDTRSLSNGRILHQHIVQRRDDKRTYIGNLIVRMYGKCGSVEEALAAFHRIEKPNMYSWNIIIVAYAQNGHMKEAKKLFDKIPLKDHVITWSAMIQGYSQNGLSRQAFALFQIMDLEGICANRVTYVSVVDACGSLQSLLEGRIVHEEAVHLGLHLDVVIGTALVKMYGEHGSIGLAKEAFDKMPNPNVVSWTAMMSAYAQNGYLQDAKELFDLMPERNVISWNSMITAYAQVGRVEDARNIFNDMLERDVSSWNAMISGYSLNGLGMKSIEIFRMMDLEGVRFDKLTLISIFDACGISSVLEEGKNIYKDVLSMGLGIDYIVENAVLNMYSKCGCLETTMTWFTKMRRKDLVSWNSMLGTFFRSGHVESGFDMFYTMGNEGIMPDGISFTSILTACSHTGLVADGCNYFQEISGSYGMIPGLDHYVCMVDLLGRAGCIKEAQELYAMMPFEPTVIARKSLLSACNLQECSLALD